MLWWAWTKVVMAALFFIYVVVRHGAVMRRRSLASIQLRRRQRLRGQ
ncbi:MAG: hypothetical protein ACM3ZQ_06590 [Bacillota bacterium]